MMQKEYVKNIFDKALRDIGISHDFDISFDIPKNLEHGDLSTNIAMQLTKELKKAPRNIAEEIINQIDISDKMISKIDIAGPGFINIKFSDEFYSHALEKLYAEGEKLGYSKIGNGKTVNVEYVSVNPTGLLHIGHGRNAVIGDTIASLYEACGYEVTREYYFNNAGNQMNNLAKSIFARYKQKFDDKNFPFPEDGYHGEYLKEIAESLYDQYKNRLMKGSFQDMTDIRKFGESWCFERIKATLTRLSINQDIYYNEDSLYKEGKIKYLIDYFKKKGLAYEKDGALWLKLSEMGLKDDRVIVKSSGEPTYRLPDIAYHNEKYKRGYDIIIDILGSDHIATIPDVLAAIKSLGHDVSKVRVIIHQFVTLSDQGEQIKMSKRTGKSYTLDMLLDEVGEDVVRFFLLMRSSTTHLDFDLGLAREQSDKNPVFYLQYAHARICSIFEQAGERGIEIAEKANTSLLIHASEIQLIKALIKFEELIQTACNRNEPHLVTDYLRDLASAFHNFYHHCRILGEEDELMQARFILAETTKRAMRNGLNILNISTPTKM